MEYRYTLDTKKVSFDFINEWTQFSEPSRYNWIPMHLLNVSAEFDRMCGNSEIEIYVLLFGVRIYWETPTPLSKVNHEKWAKSMEKYKKGKEW